MRLPRDLSADVLINRLRGFGYTPTRQTGSHIRLSRVVGGASHSITVPRHKALRVGTLNSILTEIAKQLEITKDDLVRRITQ